MMFIEVRKVATETKRAEDGSEVVNPASRSKVQDTRLVIHKEVIRVDEIRSFRHWDKDANQEAYIEGDITKLYLIGDKTRNSRPEMLINESMDSFMNRLNAIKYEQAEAKSMG